MLDDTAPMCAGLAVMCGPPTVAAACWTLWAAGKDAALRRVGLAECPPMSFFFQGSVGLGSLVAAYQAQKAVLVRHFDEGGVLSLDWKKGATTVSHPRPASRRPHPTRSRLLLRHRVAGRASQDPDLATVLSRRWAAGVRSGVGAVRFVLCCRWCGGARPRWGRAWEREEEEGEQPFRLK